MPEQQGGESPLVLPTRQEFVYSTVASVADPLGTSLVLHSGDVAAVPFPDPRQRGIEAYDITIWPVGARPLAANAEIAQVLAADSATDTLTLSRPNLSRSILVGDQVAGTHTADSQSQIDQALLVLEQKISNLEAALADPSRLDGFPNDPNRLLTGGLSGGKASWTYGQPVLFTSPGQIIIGSTQPQPRSDTTIRYVQKQFLNIGNVGGVMTVNAEGNAPSWTDTVSSTYTPTLVQSGAVTKTVTYAHYIQVGKLVFCWLTLTVTGAGTTNNPIVIGLPAAAASSSFVVCGDGIYFDTSASINYPFDVFINSTADVVGYRSDVSALSPIGQDPNIALAVGDVLYLFLTYEAA